VTIDVGPEEIRFRDAGAFDEWLAVNHGRHEGIWLKMAKKGSGIASITSDEAVDVGLCWGWISSHRKALDGTYYLPKYTPHRPDSRRAKVNITKVAALTSAGRMRPPGQAEVDAAIADGSWAASY
jgi:uncharacterized protein YdeI (YjbR/CyaY-like superfamily)